MEVARLWFCSEGRMDSLLYKLRMGRKGLAYSHLGLYVLIICTTSKNAMRKKNVIYSSKYIHPNLNYELMTKKKKACTIY